MANTNEYLKRYNEINSNADANGGVNTSSSSAVNDYYNMARNQEYNLLFDKEVALENAKANSLKYTQNQLNAQGLGSTGYGSSLMSGIYNTYLQKAGEAKADYGNNISNINMQEAQDNEAKANDRFQSITTMLSQADSVDSMNSLLANYGYGNVDSDGNFTWNKEKPEGMSDDDWYQMQYYYRLQQNALPSGSNDAKWADRVAQIAGFTEKDGVTYNDVSKAEVMLNQFKETTEGAGELKNFFMTANNGEIASISNGKQTKYYMYYNGKLYEVDEGVLSGRKPKVNWNVNLKKQ